MGRNVLFGHCYKVTPIQIETLKTKKQEPSSQIEAQNTENRSNTDDITTKQMQRKEEKFI